MSYNMQENQRTKNIFDSKIFEISQFLNLKPNNKRVYSYLYNDNNYSNNFIRKHIKFLKRENIENLKEKGDGGRRNYINEKTNNNLNILDIIEDKSTKNTKFDNINFRRFLENNTPSIDRKTVLFKSTFIEVKLEHLRKAEYTKSFKLNGILIVFNLEQSKKA